MLKVGDMVDYHSIIGEKITSRHHIITHIKPTPNNYGYAVAWITGMPGCVVLEALTLPEGWQETWLEDIGLCEEALDMITAEDVSQRERWGNQRHHAHRWNTILTEEVGELAKAVLEDNVEQIEKEATQVVTLALKMAYMARQLRLSNGD